MFINIFFFQKKFTTYIMEDSMEILYACKEGNIEKVRSILNNTSYNPLVYDKVDEIGDVNALHIASFLNHVEIMKLLLEDGRICPSISGLLITLGNLSPMGISSRLGHVEIVKLILKDGRFDPNEEEDLFCFTPLTWACLDGHVEVVKVLLNDPRVDINATDAFSYNCLCYACSHNNYELIEIILSNPRFDNIKINKISLRNSYETVCSNKYIEIIKLFIVHVDSYKFEIEDSEIDRYDDTVLNVLKTFKGSEEYIRMKCKYTKDYTAGIIFHNIVLLSDDYLKIQGC